MSDDLVQRLRAAQDYHREFGTGLSNIWAEAADEIERLRKLVATFEETAAELLRKGTDQADEIVRLQQALRDLLDAEDDFHVKAKQTHDSASAQAFLASSKARDRALAAARAVLDEGNQQ